MYYLLAKAAKITNLNANNANTATINPNTSMGKSNF